MNSHADNIKHLTDTDCMWKFSAKIREKYKYFQNGCSETAYFIKWNFK
jgi:hypothetical protein